MMTIILILLVAVVFLFTGMRIYGAGYKKGIEDVLTKLTPEERAEIIKELLDENRKTRVLR